MNNSRKKVTEYDYSYDVVSEHTDATIHAEGCLWRFGPIKATPRIISWGRSLEDYGIHHACPECGVRLYWRKGKAITGLDETRKAMEVCRLICDGLRGPASGANGSFATAEIWWANEHEIFVMVRYGHSDDCSSSVHRGIERIPRSALADGMTAEDALKQVVVDEDWDHECNTAERD